MRNPNHCSKSCLEWQFIPPAFSQFIISMGCFDHACEDYKDVLTPPHGLKGVHDLSMYMFTCMSAYCPDLHVCTVMYYGNKRDVFNQHNTQHTDSYGRVSLYACYKISLFTWTFYWNHLEVNNLYRNILGTKRDLKFYLSVIITLLHARCLGWRWQLRSAYPLGY